MTRLLSSVRAIVLTSAIAALMFIAGCAADAGASIG
jgi:hypothetical protein